ncbi:hypothetical protein GE09DRAFT_1065337 [Coniochaeta sp. 2T2.1]|nr:hypothetical protein GE09DRAFT_1065337 [Coniochaeta sp. 2T2.1]
MAPCPPSCIWLPRRNPDGSIPDHPTYEVWLLPNSFDEQRFLSLGSDPVAYNNGAAGRPQSEHDRSSQPTPQDGRTPLFSSNATGNDTPAHSNSHGTSDDDGIGPSEPQISHITSTALVPHPPNHTIQQHSVMDDGYIFHPMRPTLAAQPLPPFHPLQNIVQGRARPLAPAAAQRIDAGFSPNYLGNIFLDRNRSADIPNSENCSLFITRLPAWITHHLLLRAVRNTGRVYALHLNPPDSWNGHPTCAAKINFFTRLAAERFAHRSRGGLHIPGYVGRARVVWNRVRMAAVDKPEDHTRVLMITGPPAVVNEALLRAYFGTKFHYDVDEVIDHGLLADGQRALVEFRFGSYRCQSESGWLAIRREFSADDVQVAFGRDPCD